MGSSACSEHADIARADGEGGAAAPTAIRWTTSNGSFISDIDSSGIAYDLMTPMISGASSDNNPGAALQLSDDRYFTTQMEPMDATVGGVSLSHEGSDPTSPSSN